MKGGTESGRSFERGKMATKQGGTARNTAEDATAKPARPEDNYR
ncbi:MAG: hypothetical protein RR034_09155 [Bacteroidales bacterium]